MKGLSTLNLEGCNITDAGLARLSELKGLSTLNLAGCNITDDGLESLSELKGLSTLNLEGCKKITNKGLVCLKTLPKLTHLNVQKTGTTAAGRAQLHYLQP